MSSIIFGPVYSRRFGKSLGIDLSPSRKQCNFDCLYCELEPAKTMDHFEDVISVAEVMEALKKALKEHPDVDFITLTANGEPTLYPHLSELIDEIDKIKGEIKTLILSNAGTIDDPKVQEALLKLDEVKLSLDCATQTCLKKLDRAHPGIEVENIKRGMLAFKSRYQGPLIVEILVVKTLNDKPEEIALLNEYLLKLRPTRIDLGTIDRPPAYDVKPLSYEELLALSKQFDASLPLYIVSRRKSEARASSYTNDEILETLAMRPLSPDDIEVLFDEESQKKVEKLLNEGNLKIIESNGVKFYVLA
ncbi:radical SAM protein [Sulfurovum sp.]|jgi:wyosine [tRNA(Phe)-imidazoG37] synthetase (radical SAM superfamily)|uniref:radical SAM protein n=1 Tax=Sulfurovum sp. TaxID=1969726 RepID=UPI002A35B016|nr:radical SAM protein [Sulfurovum sp.]MDD2451844.1 radical SAM protein [Sulfurovum sp.]MDD3500726.1 radical SAM protein [Sulfurovum sp.]MDY0402948.1 radical SAM protein [Sulfurovum sp.]